MRDPAPDSVYFKRDRITAREILRSWEDIAELPGARREREAAGFSSTTPLRVRLALSDGDLTRFNALCLQVTNKADIPVLVGINLEHTEPDPDDPYRVDASTSGGREWLPARSWKELQFPNEAFATYGFPQHRWVVTAIELIFSREKGQSNDLPIEIGIGDLLGEYRRHPRGPRLTDAGLHAVLTDPERTRVGSVLDSSRVDLFSLSHPASRIPAPHPYPQDTPRDVLAGRIMGRRVGIPIPWDANPFGALEWSHFLHRHHFLRALLESIGVRQSDLHVSILCDLIEDWIAANPVPTGCNGGAGPAWETLSAAWRLREWFRILGTARRHPAFRARTRNLMLASLWEHARHLTDHRGHPNNWIVVESSSLALVGMLFPEFREAEEWTETGVDRLSRALEQTYFSDGVQYEISPLYHAICFQCLLDVQRTADACDRPLPPIVARIAATSGDYLAALVRPDFTWPSLNDSGSSDGHYCELMYAAGLQLNRQDYLWIGSRGREGLPPGPATSVFSDAGIAALRSGRDSSADMVVLRAGPPGAFHAHADTLSLEVTVGGVRRLVDPGITAYAPDPVRDWYRDHRAHSSVWVDGFVPAAAGGSFSDRTRPAGARLLNSESRILRTVTGSARFVSVRTEEQCVIQRSVIDVRGEYRIVRDWIQGSGDGEIKTAWQFAPGRVEIDIETFSAVSVEQRGPHFAVIPLTGKPGPEIEVYTGSHKPARGWVSVRGKDVPASYVLYTLPATLPWVMIWVLIPFTGRPTNPGIKAARIDAGPGTTDVELRFPDGRVDKTSLVLGSFGEDNIDYAEIGTVRFSRIVSSGALRTDGIFRRPEE